MPRTNSTVRQQKLVVASPNKTQPVVQVPVQTSPSFARSVMDGFSIGLGQSIAFNAIQSVVKGAQVDTKELCKQERVEFENCMRIKTQDGFCGDKQNTYSQCLQDHS